MSDRAQSSGRPWYVRVAAAVTVVAVVGVAVVPALPGHGGRVRCLRALTKRLAAGSDRPAPGRWQYLHLRQLAKQEGPQPLAGSDEFRWRATDGSGRAVRVPVYGYPWQVQDGAGRAVGAPKYIAASFALMRSDFAAGGMPATLTGRARPGALADQLAALRRPQDGPGWMVRAYVDVYQTHWPSRDVRVALLRVLADAEQLSCARPPWPHATDHAITVSVPSAGRDTRDWLYVDRETGGPIAYEVVVVHAGRPTLRQAVLWQRHGRVDEIGVIPAPD